MPGPDHADLARVLYNLAGIYKRQVKYAEAERLYRRALAIEEKALGRDHADVATTLNDLAGVYERQGKYAEAEGSSSARWRSEKRRSGANTPTWPDAQ